MTDNHTGPTLTLEDLLSPEDLQRAVREALTFAGADGMTEEELDAFGSCLTGVVFNSICLDMWHSKILAMGYDVEQDAIRWRAITYAEAADSGADSPSS